MIIYNLTDVPTREQPKRVPIPLQMFGQIIKPGEYGEFSDDVPLSKISGWVYSKRISVDSIPRWYKEAKQARSKAKRVTPSEETPVIGNLAGVREEEPVAAKPEEEEPKEKPKKKKGKKK